MLQLSSKHLVSVSFFLEFISCEISIDDEFVSELVDDKLSAVDSESILFSSFVLLKDVVEMGCGPVCIF